MPWRRDLMVSSPPAELHLGREIESRRGIGGSYKNMKKMSWPIANNFYLKNTIQWRDSKSRPICSNLLGGRFLRRLKGRNFEPRCQH
jgi:hypothetical protein